MSLGGPWSGAWSGPNLSENQLAFISARVPGSTVESVREWYDPTPNEMNRVEGRVLVISDFEQGNYIFGVNDKNLVPLDVH